MTKLKCPQCGSENVYTTDMGFSGANMNDVKCACGHYGTAQDWVDIQKLKEFVIEMRKLYKLLGETVGSIVIKL